MLSSFILFNFQLYHALIQSSCCFCWLVQFLLRNSMVWVCTQTLGRMNMLICSNLGLHTQITINCACNISRLFIPKISTKLCIQCSVVYEYKRGICSNISKKEYLCVQIWLNSIILCTHFSNLETGRPNLIIFKVRIKCLKGRQLSLWLIVDVYTVISRL